MAKKASKAVEQDVAGLRQWLTGLVAPLQHFFQGRVLWLLLIPIGVWAYLDRPLLKTWLSLVVGAVLIPAVALLIRKIVMPRVDIQGAAEKAQEDPVGAALIFLGGVIFMSVAMIVIALFLGSMRG